MAVRLVPMFARRQSNHSRVCPGERRKF